MADKERHIQFDLSGAPNTILTKLLGRWCVRNPRDVFIRLLLEEADRQGFGARSSLRGSGNLPAGVDWDQFVRMGAETFGPRLAKMLSEYLPPLPPDDQEAPSVPDDPAGDTMVAKPTRGARKTPRKESDE